MFTTSAAAEVYVPLHLSEVGEQAWDYVSLRLHIPWLYVELSYEAKKKG